MYCKHCGNEIDENSKFCPACGASTKDDVINTEAEVLITNNSNFYCTQCGSAIFFNTKKCKKCAYKVVKNANKHCRYCGGIIKNNKCVTCEMNSRQGVFETILRIICYIFVSVSFLGAMIDLLTGDVLASVICFIVPFLLCLFVLRKKQIFKFKRRLKSKKKFSLVTIFIYALALVIMILGMRCSGLVGSANDETQCRDVATEYAHTKLKGQNFKNPNSLQINDTNIDNEFDDEEYYYYKIIVDYSAQNGFGGYNRDTFEVVVKVNKATRQAISIDFAEYVEAYSSYVDKLK